jgi:hypothetical protein
MFPTYTLNYWIGLRSNRTDWPLFDWMNMAFLPPKRFRDRWGQLSTLPIRRVHATHRSSRQGFPLPHSRARTRAAAAQVH